MHAEPRKTQQDKSNKPILPIIIISVLLAAGAYWYWQQKAPQPEPLPEQVEPLEPQPVDGTAPAPEPEPPAVQAQADAEPGPEPAAPPAATEPEPEPLPTLAASDPVVREELQAMLPADAPFRLEQPDLVRQMVQYGVTLADGYLPPRQKLIAPLSSSFEVLRMEDGLYLDPENYRRYDPYVNALVAVDDQRLLGFLTRFQPLFQDAVKELGLPGDAFGENLDQTLTLLLATPEPQEPLRLSQPKVLYQFADQDLERLQPIQKLLLRMGPDNRGRLKAKLLAIKALEGQGEP